MLKHIEESIIKDYLNKVRTKDIVAKYKISRPTVYNILKRNNQTERNKSSYELNDNWMEFIDTEEKALINTVVLSPCKKKIDIY